MSAEVDLPAPLRDWLAAITAEPVLAATRHFAGASRDAWNVDVGRGESARALFLLCDKGGGGGSARDAAVLAALADTPIPVPVVVARDEASGAILLERIPGRSDFPSVDREAEREPTARHLMELTGALHRLDPAALEIPHLTLPSSAADCPSGPLSQARQAAAALGGAVDPFFRFALDWLERNVPAEVPGYALVHSDMGPGNFLFQAGRVTGIVDWEVAHFGDPMEDLAAIAVRDMATPVGHLPTRLAEYESSCGIEVDLARVGYYRALVLVRNSLMIGLGLAHPPPSFDFVEMTMYQTLLQRAAALVLCDNLGLARPASPARGAAATATATPDRPEAPEQAARRDLIAALRRDLSQSIGPALAEGLAARRAAGVERGLATLDHEDRVGPALDRAELDDLGALLGRRPADRPAGERRLRERVAEAGGRAPDAGGIGRAVASAAGHEERRWASYFARRMQRLAERRRPLMGELADRLPQPLEASTRASLGGDLEER